MKVRKVRGPILDKLYAELKRCGDLACNGRPFIEHRNVPVLVINPRDSRPAWQQVTETLTEAIRSGILVPGDELPSITELSALQGIGTGVIRHALETLTAARLGHSGGGATTLRHYADPVPEVDRRLPRAVDRQIHLPGLTPVSAGAPLTRRRLRFFRLEILW